MGDNLLMLFRCQAILQLLIKQLTVPVLVSGDDRVNTCPYECFPLVYGLSHSHELQQMAHSFFFGTQITPRGIGWRNHQGDALDYFESHFFERAHLLRIV